MRRLFLAHPKDHEQLPQLVEQVKALLVRLGVPAGCEVVSGESDFNMHFQRHGGWNGWIHSVVWGSEYRGSVLVPRYDVVLVAPYQQVGRATSQIVSQALSARKPVFYFDPVEGSAQPVLGVYQERKGDYRTGWSLAVPAMAEAPLSSDATG